MTGGPPSPRPCRGYRTYEQMVGMIELPAGACIERRNLEFDDLSVLDFVEKHESAAARELAEVFEVSHAQAKASLDRLVASGSMQLPKPGLLYRAPDPIACDTATGRCS